MVCHRHRMELFMDKSLTSLSVTDSRHGQQTVIPIKLPSRFSQGEKVKARNAQKTASTFDDLKPSIPFSEEPLSEEGRIIRGCKTNPCNATQQISNNTIEHCNHTPQ